jgi:hypothetical protein
MGRHCSTFADHATTIPKEISSFWRPFHSGFCKADGRKVVPAFRAQKHGDAGSRKTWPQPIFANKKKEPSIQNGRPSAHRPLFNFRPKNLF